MKIWKRKWKSAVSLLLALILTLSSMPFYFSHAEENDSNDIIFTNFQMMLNGKAVSEDPKDPTVFRKSEAFTIDLEWELPDSLTEEEDYVCDLDLSERLKNLKLSNIGKIDLEQNDETIGSFHVGQNNKISIKINKEAIGHLNHHTGWAQIAGVLSDTISDKDHGEKLNIGIGNKAYWIQYDAELPESSLDVSKYLPDDKVVRREAGKYIQTFGVTLTAKKGEVTLTGLENSLGEYLEDISKVKITKSDIDGVAAGAYDSWDALVAALQNKTLKKDQAITLTYDVEVAEEHIFDFNEKEADSLEEYRNTITVEYNTNQGTPDEQSASARAFVALPTVSSSGIVSEDKEEVDWTITLQLNSLWEEGESLEELGVTNLSATLGDEFEAVEGLDDIELDEIEDKGNGKYIYTFTAPIREAYQEPLDNTVLRNDVTLSFGEQEITGGGEVTLRATGEEEPDKVSRLTKTGRYDSKDPMNVLTYEVQVDLEGLNLQQGKKIVLTDQLPEGMELVWDSVTVIYPKGKPVHIPDFNVTDEKGKENFTVDITVSSEILEDQNSDDLKKLRVSYKTRKTDMSDTWKAGETEKLTNTVSGTYNTTTDLGSASADMELDPPQLVFKSVDVTSTDIIYSNTRPRYTLGINPGAMDLVEGDGRIQAVDVLGPDSALKYDQSSIVVQRQTGINTWEDIAKGADGYTCEYDVTENALKFDLPDETAIRITYNTFIRQGVKKLDEENFSNRVSLTGYAGNTGSQTVAFKFKNSTVKYVGASAGGDNGTITVNKYWEQDGVRNHLSGSEFDIYRMNDDESLMYWKECRASSNTDGEEQYVVSRLQYDKVYVLRETKADIGFRINTEDYYFYIHSQGIEGIEELEENGYEVVEGDQEPSGNNIPIHMLADGAELDFENEMEDNAGFIRLRKIVEGPITQEKDLKYITFEIGDGSGKKQTIKLSQMRKDSESTDTYRVYEKQVVCSEGIYSVKESNALVDGFIADTTYNVNGTEGTGADAGNIPVRAGETQEVTFTNDYQEDLTQGRLMLTKTLEGPVSQTEAEETLEFQIYEKDNTDKEPIAAYTLGEFTKVGTMYTKELPLSAGTYTVREVNYDSLTGCELESVEYLVNEDGYRSGDTAEVAVVAGKPTRVHFTDTYTGSEEGSLRIIKTIQGSVTKKEAEDALRFRVTNRETKREVAAYTLKDFTLQAQEDDSFVYVLELPYLVGGYQVEESVAFISGYEETVSHAVGDDTLTGGNKAQIEISDGTVTEVSFRDEYTEIENPGELEITKTIQGAVTREEAEGALRFLVTRNSDGKAREFALRDFGYNDKTGIYSLKLGVAADSYTVEEIQTDIDGYVTQGVQYSLDGTAIAGTSVTTDVAAGETTTVSVIDTYMKKGAEKGLLVLTKQILGDVTREEAERDLRFTIRDTGSANIPVTYSLKYFTYNEVTGIYTMELEEPVGLYTVEETITDIRGYVLKSAAYTVAGVTTEGTSARVVVNTNERTQVDFKDVYDKQGSDTPGNNTPVPTAPTGDVATKTPTPSAVATNTPTPTAVRTPSPTGKVDNDGDDDDDDDTKGGKKHTKQKGSTPKTADERYMSMIAEFVAVLISGCGIILLTLRQRRYAYIKRHAKGAVNLRKKENKK